MSNTEVKILPHQKEAWALMLSHSYTLLFGGARSGKTFIILLLNLLMANTFDPERAKKDKTYEIRKPSRHLIVRFHFSDVKKSIIKETLPEVAALLGIEYKLNQQDWYIELPNGSEIWFGGIDEGRGLDRVLGKEYSTIWFNEASQIKYSTFWFLMSRLAQDTGFRNRHMYYDGMPKELSAAIGWLGKDEKGENLFDGVLSELSSRVFFDENPPSKAHWTYKVFFEGINPDKRLRLRNPEDYAALRMNPSQNIDNIDKGFLDRLNDAPDDVRIRMLEGNFADEIKGSLFNETNINNNRIELKNLPELRKVVVAVDPATTSNAQSDETGIIVAGEVNGKAYVLDDVSGIYSPKEWADKVKEKYIEWDAECVIAEANQGGEMVEHTIQTADKNIPVKLVTAFKGKYLRAQPVSVLYDKNKVSHVGAFTLLEEEQTTYTGEGKSPNRLDALVYAMLYLFPVGLSKEGEPFNEKNIVYFEDDEDFTGCKTIAFLKIADANCYNFSMMIMKVKQRHFYITEVLFNDDYPNDNLLRVLSKIGENDISKLFIECDISYSIFAQTLMDQSGIDVIGSLLPSDAMNRIMLESKFIKTNFTFKDNIMDGQYNQFIKQLNYFTNLSAKHESFAADLCAFASFMIHLNIDEFKK